MAMMVKGSAGITPEILAAIGVSVAMVLEETEAEMMAAVVAAIVHSHSSFPAVRIKRTSSAWTLMGRQRLMDNRL